MAVTVDDLTNQFDLLKTDPQKYLEMTEALMPLPVIREFKLAGPRGDGLHAYVNRDGAFIG